MPCLLVGLAMLMPRLLMFFIWMLTDWFSRAYGSQWVWALLGFFFMPYTTLAYMAAMLNNARQVNGLWLVLLIIAIVVDLGHWGAGKRVKASWRHR